MRISSLLTQKDDIQSIGNRIFLRRRTARPPPLLRGGVSSLTASWGSVSSLFPNHFSHIASLLKSRVRQKAIGWRVWGVTRQLFPSQQPTAMFFWLGRDEAGGGLCHLCEFEFFSQRIIPLPGRLRSARPASERYLHPPNYWMVATLESKELLTLCLGRGGLLHSPQYKNTCTLG